MNPKTTPVSIELLKVLSSLPPNLCTWCVDDKWRGVAVRHDAGCPIGEVQNIVADL